MPRSVKRLVCTLVFVLPAPLASLAHLARADSPPPPLELAYEVPGGNCPTEADFEARVQSRTSLARFGESKGGWSAHVAVRALGGTYAGHLSFVGHSGRVTERDVEDIDCSEVVDALALITALAIDPNAAVSPRTPSLADASPEAQTPTEAAAVDEGPTPPPQAGAVPLLPTRLSVVPEPDESTARRRTGWRSYLAGTFVTLAGIAPDTIAGGGVFGEIAPDTRRWLAPTARLTIFAAENGVFATRNASFLLVAGRMDVCPARVGSLDLSLRPCLAADIGGVRAEGIDVVVGGHGVPGSEFWFDFALLLRARWAPGGGRFFVEAEGGAFVPLDRASFVYENPLETIDTPWFVGVDGSLAMGLRLW